MFKITFQVIKRDWEHPVMIEVNTSSRKAAVDNARRQVEALYGIRLGEPTKVEPRE